MFKFDSVIDIVLFIIEIIGCISFATSGAISALRKKTDILGVIILSLISIFGGGLLRDLIIGDEIPHIFYDNDYLFLAAISIVITLVWFFLAYFKKTAPIIEKHRHDLWIYLIDAIGMSVFCVYGVRYAYESMSSEWSLVGKYVYLVCLGVITGVGGGMFRDVFIGEIPMVFKKHFYMTPCILGCLAFAIMYMNNCNLILSHLVGIVIIVGLRTFATLFKWNLPSAKAYNEILENKENKKE